MRNSKVLLIAVAALALAGGAIQARTRKGDLHLAKARASESRDDTADLDAALDLAKQALQTDPSEIEYQIAVNRLRAFTSQYHVYDGQVARDKGDLKKALIEFEKAAALDPSSLVAPQEAARTRGLIKELAANPTANLADLILRPLPRKNRQDEAKYSDSATARQIEIKSPPTRKYCSSFSASCMPSAVPVTKPSNLPR
jgi:tetratricopeptide (TPR) repeat protein